jgi:hypothetical protein
VKPVLDRGVIVAVLRGLRGLRGASATILRAALGRYITLMASVPLVIEYEATCSRSGHRETAGLTKDELRQFLDAVAALVDPVETHFP